MKSGISCCLNMSILNPSKFLISAWFFLPLKFGRSILTDKSPVCCLFWPAFGCCVHPKAGRTTFFQPFLTFLLFLFLFHWFHGWNQQKTSENEQKKVYSSKLVDIQKLVDSLRRSLKFVFFWLIKKSKNCWLGFSYFFCSLWIPLMLPRILPNNFGG